VVDACWGRCLPNHKEIVLMADQNLAKSVFLKATEMPQERRKEYLDAACFGDALLRERVDALLKAHDSPESFLERPVFGSEALREVETVDFPSEKTYGKVNQYKILQKIGEGGFGLVFLAEQQGPIRRRVALKIIKPGMDSQQVIARFEVERQALAMMDHPNIARVFDAGTTDSGLPFFVMELIKGVPVTEYCDRNSLTLLERLRLLVPVCQAIHHAHQKGIIHRDIKPTNVLVSLFDGQPVPKVIDFGVAKATMQPLTEKTLFTTYGQVVGTPEYMSPEQAEFNQLDVDTRSDVYSLGVLLYTMLTGSTPLTRKELLETGIAEMLRMIREKEPECPSIRLSRSCITQPEISEQRRMPAAKLNSLIKGDLDWIVMKALDKNRNRRYDSANEMALDIQRFLDEEPVSASPPSRVYQLRKFAMKHRAVALTTCMVFVILMSATFVSLLQWRSANRAREMAVLAREAEYKHRQLAENLAHDALEQSKRADQNLEEATRRASEVAAANLRAQQNLYVAQMNLVGKAMETGNLATATKLLNRHAPMSVRRGFEWYYWKNQCDIIKLQTTIPAIAQQLAVSPDGKRIATSALLQGYSSLDVMELETSQRKKVSTAAGALTFSRDSKRLATASVIYEEPLITLRDVDTNTVVATIKPSAPVHEIAFSPDERYLGALTEEGIVLFDVAGEKIARKLVIENATPASFAFREDGQSVLVGYRDGRVALWDLMNDDRPEAFRTRADALTTVQFVPKSDLIVLATHDGNAELWNIEKQSLHLRYSLGGEPFSRIAISPDGQTLLAGNPNGLARVIELHTGSELVRFIADTEYLFSLGFMPSGREIISLGASVKLWKLNPQQCRVTIKESAESFAISPDGELLSCRNCLRTVSGDSRIQLDLQAAVLTAEFSPDGRYLATGANTGRVDIWDSRTGKSIKTLQGHQKHVMAIAFSPDGKFITTGSTDASLKIWDLEQGACIRTLTDHPTPVTSIHYSKDGTRIASANGDRQVRIWNSQTGSVVKTMAHSEQLIHHLEFSPDGKILATSAENVITLWSVDTGEKLRTFEGHSGFIWDFAFCSDGLSIASASQDKTVRLWDVATGDEVASFVFQNPIRNVRFSRDATRIAIASATEVTVLFGPIRVVDAPFMDETR
jgi:WD40 repeat protein/serine/threonine protein kinase